MATSDEAAANERRKSVDLNPAYYNTVPMGRTGTSFEFLHVLSQGSLGVERGYETGSVHMFGEAWYYA